MYNCVYIYCWWKKSCTTWDVYIKPYKSWEKLPTSTGLLDFWPINSMYYMLYTHRSFCLWSSPTRCGLKSPSQNRQCPANPAVSDKQCPAPLRWFTATNMFIYTPRKTHMERQSFEDASPIKRWWFSIVMLVFGKVVLPTSTSDDGYIYIYLPTRNV